MTDAAAPTGATGSLDVARTVRSRSYLSALVLAALLGIPVSAVAYGFLALVSAMQKYLFTDLPSDLFEGSQPAWWPLPWLMLCGLLVALTIRHLPGTAGHSPALGFTAGGGPAAARDLPGIVLAALLTLGLGAVLGPEAPLIALGGGLGALTVRLAKRDAPPMAATMMASAGSFAAVSTLLGSPLLGAFLIMEAAGIAGATLSLVALPGLLASGIGALVFVGLDHWTGLGTFSLALTTVPPGVQPTIASLLWSIPVGVLGALLGWAVRRLGLGLRPHVHRNRVAVTVGLGLVVGLCATVYQLTTGRAYGEVLFSGQSALPGLVAGAAGYSIWVLVLLGLLKSVAYGVSLSAFRGGPVFPAMFIGAVLGIALSPLPGMELAAAIGTGIGAMCCAMLRLPLTSVLLATLLMGTDGLTVIPQVAVAVVVSFVVSAVLPLPTPAPAAEPAAGAHSPEKGESPRPSAGR